MKQKLYKILIWAILWVYAILSLFFIFDVTTVAFYLYIISAIVLAVFLIIQYFKEND